MTTESATQSASAPAARKAAAAEQAWVERLPSPFWIFTLALAGVLVGITVTKGVQDPDFFWHITAGQWIAQHGQVPNTDPFSFTWAGKPWVPIEWLPALSPSSSVRGGSSAGNSSMMGATTNSSVAVNDRVTSIIRNGSVRRTRSGPVR